jgi:hypothetical protein
MSMEPSFWVDGRYRLLERAVASRPTVDVRRRRVVRECDEERG